MTPQRSDSEQPRTRPPKPPDRKCQHPACIATPLYPGKDWSVFCGMHSGPLNHRLAVWVERFAERDPQDEQDYGYNIAVTEIARELRTPTPGSEAPPIEAEAGAASPAEPLQRLHRAVAGLPVHMGHGAIRAIEVLELIEAEQRAALAAPSQERASEPAGLDHASERCPNRWRCRLDVPSGSGYATERQRSADLAAHYWIGCRRITREEADAIRGTASAAAQERPADAALREAVWIVARKSDGEAMAVYAVEQDAVEDVARRHRCHRDRYKVEAWQVLQPSPEPDAPRSGTEGE